MTKQLVVLSGGTSDPSSTRMLADRIASRVIEAATAEGVELAVRVVELRPLAADIAAAQVAGFASGRVLEAAQALAAADAVIVATPVYKAGISGLVKSFLDVLDQDVLIATPVVLAATAGSARHALVTDGEVRSLVAYLRALPVPTSVFAAQEDWGSTELARRIDRAANELVVLVAAGVRERMREAPAASYQRVFGGTAGAHDVDLDTDLMRLAAGG